MSTHNVPRSTPSGRSSHSNRLRTSHDYDAYASGLGGGSVAGEQASVDAGSGPLTIFPGVVKDLTNVPAEVVIDAVGVTVTNGAMTVKNAGATVIIDGTSNMFKIVATGTHSTAAFANAAAASRQAITTVASGITVVPAYNAFIESAPGTQATLVPAFVVDFTTAWTGKVLDQFDTWVDLVNTNQTKITSQTTTCRVGGTTAARLYRYFFFKEAAL